jgi:heme/copper-type cytochrome/quinol oxidase subunit 1
MFVVGMTDSARIYFSAATLVIGVPTAVKIFSWVFSFMEFTTRYVDVSLIFAFVSCFVFGGFTGLLLANAGLDLAYHDSYFVVGHFHFVLSIAATLALTIF